VTGTVRSYQACCVQAAVEIIDDPAQKDAVITRNLDRSLKIAEGAIARDNARIVVFPEGWLQGHGYRRSAEEWQAICIQIPGLETARMGEFARKHDVYLAGAAFERDLDWPEMWFSTGFIVGPSGKVELRYRKIQEHNVEGAIPNVSPADVHADYVKRYGEDSLFPVLDTPLGRLAVIVENDVNFFELTRVLVFHGAEIFLHPTAEDNGPRNTAWDQARRTRCYENLSYMITANSGQVIDESRAAFASRGCSSVIDYQGSWTARIDGPGESLVTAEIDLQRLRRRRTEIRMNYPAQVKSELFGREFSKYTMMATNTGPASLETGQAAIRRLQEKDIIVRP
jgi:predicted amidohydrolase